MRLKFAQAASLWMTVALTIGSIAAEAEPLLSSRPKHWAQPIEKAGLANFYRVDTNLYRGAQPTTQGFSELKTMGIKTVVCLRRFHSDRKRLPAGLEYEAIPMNAWHAESEDFSKFLKIVQDPAMTPVFVHCQHGSDRTGVACAVYRVAVQGWTIENASTEMTEGGYGFWPNWTNLVEYLRGLDIESLR